MQKKNETPHDNKASDEPKTELPDSRRQIGQRLDFFTEPRQGEKYLKDLEDELVYLAQAHIDKARLEQMVAVLLSMGGEIEITASAIREADSRNFTISSQPTSWLDGGLVYKLARLKSDKDKQ